MTQTASSAITDLTRKYLAVWSIPDLEDRRAAVAGLWAPDAIEYVDGGTHYRGHDELTERVTGAYDAFIGNGKYTLTGADDVTVHDDLVEFSVHLTEPSGEAAWTSRVFALVGPDGTVEEDYHIVIKPLPSA